MFKLVVLSAFLAAAVAEPSGAFYGVQPLTYSSTVISPAVTTISKQASSVIHPSPSFYYSAPTAFTHFIKKRSAPLLFPTTYAAGSPVIATAYNTPLLTSGAVLPGAHVLTTPIVAPIAAAPIATHLIKKRSPQIITPLPYATYNKPLTYSSPFISSSPFLSSPYFSSPVITHTPVTYSHLIKKRSAPLTITTPYIAPAAITHQSTINLAHSPLIPSYSTPLAYSTPLGYSHIY